MKTKTYLALCLTILLTVSCNGQTPEQKKKEAEVEAMVAEMQRKADSMMNDLEMEKWMEHRQKI